MNVPVVGVTMGDAAGIGPEIIVKALSDPAVYAACRPVVIGDRKILDRAVRLLGLDLQTRPAVMGDYLECIPGKIDCIDLDLLPAGIPFGELSPLCGEAAFRYLERAIRLAGDGQIDAICTAPLNKEALHLGGHDYPGHTEILAEFTGTQDFAMMLASPQLKVVLVTIHLGLLKAIHSITPEKVRQTIFLAHAALQQMGTERPRIAVCAINPHAGEAGLFGNREEEDKIVPAIQEARQAGLEVSGPHPADTVFYRAVREDFDVVIAMYHDQGLIPIKTLGIEAGVNLTIGLPFIRTSVDHGTAFDIAGKGSADGENMKTAILKAAELAARTRLVQDSNGTTLSLDDGGKK